jgi:hypothetical protein
LFCDINNRFNLTAERRTPPRQCCDAAGMFQD